MRVVAALALALWASVAEAQTVCNGLTPTIWAATAAAGAADGSSEANAVAIATALSSAVAGDVVCLASGVYIGAHGGGSVADPIFQFTNSGSSGNPITLTCKYQAVELALAGDITSDSRRCEFQYTGGTAGTSTTRPVVGNPSNGQDYTRWYGLYVQANTSVAPCAPSHGCMKIAGTGHVHENHVIDQGTAIADYAGDNFTIWFSLGADSLVLRNSWVRGGDNGTLEHPNASVFTLYGSRDFLIEHNRFDDVTSGIFVKGSNATEVNSGTIRYNYIDAGGHGILATADIEPEGVFVYQNIVRGGVSGVQFNSSVGALADPFHVYNNTLYDFASRGGASAGFYAAQAPGSFLRFYNNIVMFPASTSVPMIESGGFSFTSVSPLDYNLYYEAGGTASWAGESSTYTTIGDWRTYTGDEASSTVADPLFVNAGTGDFHLQAGSPALTLGRVGGVGGGGTIPAGAYVTGSETIGLNSSGGGGGSSTGGVRLRIRGA